MKKFTRQESGNTPTADINLDFSAAAAKVARVFEPNEYTLRIEASRLIQSKQNVLVSLGLIETGSGSRVDSRPLWIDGPNASVGQLAMDNRHLIAQLLAVAGLPTAGNVVSLIPQLAGLEFHARLVLAIDSRSGRTYNAIADIYADDVP
jgi:hypothetical protein